MLQARSSLVESIDRTGAQTYFTDAMGVEYLAFIMAKCHEEGLMAKTTVCRCELPSITSRNKEFWTYFSTEKYPIITVSDIDEIKHQGKDDCDYNKTKLPIHLMSELDIIDGLLRKIKANLVSGKYNKAILVSDHGASRLAVIHETENMWEMAEKGVHSGRCCLKSEVDEQPEYAADADDFWVLANYDRFKGSRKANVEVHGGAALEEVVVPITELTYLSEAIEVKLIPIDQPASFVGTPTITVESCVAADKALIKNDRDDLSQKAEKIKKRIMNYGRMRADEELSKEQYKALCSQAEEELDSIKRQLATIVDTHAKADLPYDFGKIQKALARVIDVSGAKISDELIDEFVEVVTPVENYAYRWKLNLGETKSAAERTDLTSIDTAPILSFVIDFEAAQKYRQANNMPQQFRRAAWTDLRVEVYL